MAHPRRLIVPTYVVNGGFDSKFQEEPREVPGLAAFRDALPPGDYRASVAKINAALKRSRAGKASMACLAAGPLMLPLIPYAALTYRNKRVRKRCLRRAIAEFNAEHPRLCMRWRRKPASQLVIEEADPAEFETISCVMNEDHHAEQPQRGGEFKAQSS
jgi:hypothetical protein